MLSRASSLNNCTRASPSSSPTGATQSRNQQQPQLLTMSQSNSTLLMPTTRRRSSGSSTRRVRNLRAGSFLSPHRFNKIRAQLSASGDAGSPSATGGEDPHTETLTLEPLSTTYHDIPESHLLSPPSAAPPPSHAATTALKTTKDDVAKKKEQVKREVIRENMKSVLENYSGKNPAGSGCGSGHQLSQDEEELLHAAEHGCTAQLVFIVEKHAHGIHATLVNCQDFMGRTPIMLAATGEHFDCIDYLVRKSSPQRVLEALLACIEQDLSEVSQYIIKHPVYEVDKIGARIIIGESGDIFYDRSGVDSLQYSSDITPVVLAAQKQQVETLKLLLDRGVRIERPHKITCSCTECRNRAQYDSLKHSRSRLNAYRGLTSPSYIALTATDPITEAFRLSGELRLLSGIEKEYKAQYIELSEQCEKFAVELLDHCRNTQEVRIVLKGAHQQQTGVQSFQVSPVRMSAAAAESDGIEEAHNQLALLNLAFRYNQKSFVAHASCQQQVGIFWCNGFSSWRRRPWLYRAAVIAGFMTMFPIIEIFYLLLGAWPVFQVSKLSRMPLVKFVMSIASDLYFVLILVMLGWTSTRADNKLVFCSSFGQVLQDIMASRNPLMIARFLVVAWILGQLLNVVKRLRHKGLIDFMSGWWNFIELGSCAALLVGHIIMFSDAIHVWLRPALENTGFGPDVNPTCVALSQLSFVGHQVYNCLLSLASILTFVRVTMTLFQASESFGPLQISLGRLVPEIAKYIFVFVVLMTSFNIALMMIFREYPAADDTSPTVTVVSYGNDGGHQVHNIIDATGAIVPNTYQVVIGTHPPEWISDEFSTISGTFRSLFWSLFGMSPREAAELRKRTDAGVVSSPEPYPHLAQYSGNLLFGSFHVLSIILVNILIAALAWGYTEIREDEDTEWKYARTKLRLSYIEQKNFTQPPFNLLPSSVTVAAGVKKLLTTPAKVLRKLLRRTGGGSRVNAEYFASKNDNADNFTKNKRRYDPQVSRESDVSSEPRKSMNNNVRIMPTFNGNGGNGASTKTAVLAAMKMRKQLDERGRAGHPNLSGTTALGSAVKVLTQYERLMVRLTTRWMHYKFYKHPPPPQQQIQHFSADVGSTHDLHDPKASRTTDWSRQHSHTEINGAPLREKLEQAIAGIDTLKTTVFELLVKQQLPDESNNSELRTACGGETTTIQLLPLVRIERPPVTDTKAGDSNQWIKNYVNSAFEDDDGATSIATYSTLSDSALVQLDQRPSTTAVGGRAASLPEFYIEQFDIYRAVEAGQYKASHGESSLATGACVQQPLDTFVDGKDTNYT